MFHPSGQAKGAVNGHGVDHKLCNGHKVKDINGHAKLCSNGHVKDINGCMNGFHTAASPRDAELNGKDLAAPKIPKKVALKI